MYSYICRRCDELLRRKPLRLRCTVLLFAMLLLPIPMHISGFMPQGNSVAQQKIVAAKVVYHNPVLKVSVVDNVMIGPVRPQGVAARPVSRVGGSKLSEVSSSEIKGKRVQFVITAYSAHDKGVNRKGITASGAIARPWYTVAASRGYPFGARIHLVPLKKTVVVQDRGGAIKGNRLDLFVGSRKEALQFGRQKMEGIVLED